MNRWKGQDKLQVKSASAETVPAGYKKTEVGVIPEDWEVRRLGDCLLSNPDYGINAPAVDYNDELPSYIRITDITEDGRVNSHNRVSIDHKSANNFFLNKGDIVLARTGASVGKSYLYDGTVKKVVFAGFLIRVTTDQIKLIPSFLACYLTTDKYWHWVHIMSMRSGQPGINGKEYGLMPIPLPPLPEQKAIAATLSDVDELIARLDKLIEKKKAIKTAAMQQLLTGKIRLPGFQKKPGFKKTEVGMIPEDWEVRRLEEYVEINSGESPTQYIYSTDGIPYFKVEQLNEGRKYIDITPYIFNCKRTVAAGSIIFPKRGASILLNKIRILRHDSFMDTNLMSLTTKNGLNNEFLFYCLVYLGLWKLADTTSIPQINNKHINPFKIPLPPLPEQTAIAKVLSDMDAEIESLKKRREKTRALKKGMMQQLLTGRIRLVDLSGQTKTEAGDARQ